MREAEQEECEGNFSIEKKPYNFLESSKDFKLEIALRQSHRNKSNSLCCKKNVFVDRFSAVYVRSDYLNTIYINIFPLLCSNYGLTYLSDSEATHNVEQLLTLTKVTSFGPRNFSVIKK